MAKQGKKKTKIPISAPVAPPPDDNVRWKKYFPYGITFIFFILSFIGILHHEMWRDEYQAWMVAADAHSIPQLFQNLKYEGHPALWHLFLYVISSFTADPFWMQFFHIFISAAFIFLFNRYSPFPIVQKFLFTFGYYSFFEFNLISRGYGLGLLLIVIFCILYRQRQKNILYIALVLFLVANNTIFGVIFTVCLSFILLLEIIFPDKKLKIPALSTKHIVFFAAIAFTGAILGYLQIKPEPDNSFLKSYETTFNLLRTKLAFSRLIYSYFSFPDFSTIHFWNTNFFIHDSSKFPIIIALVVLLVWVMAFMRYRLIVVLYIVGTFMLLGFHYYSGLFWNRYAGHLYVLLIVCCWLMYYQREKPYQHKLLEQISLVGSKIRTPFLILILSVHFCGGVVAYYLDIKYPFSTSAQASAFIRDNNLMHYEIIGSKDYIISPLASQLGKKILYAERREYGSFIIYDAKRMSIWSFKALESFVRDMIAKGNKRIILVKDIPILRVYDDNGETEPWVEGMLTDSLYLKKLTSIASGIVEDEAYYIYSVEEVK